MSRLQTDEVWVFVRVIVSRILLSLTTFLLVSMMVFAIIEVLPGDAATRILGRDSTPEMREQLRARLGLNDPFVVRYARWFSDAIRGDFGVSLAGNRPVSEVIAPRLKNTLILSTAAVIVYLPLSFGLGIITALYHHKGIDNFFSGVTLLGMSMPEFVIGTLLIVVFSVTLQWLPALSLFSEDDSLKDIIRKLTLPVLTLTAAMTAYGVRMLRDRLIEVFEAEFVRMATLRGLSRWRVIWRHALPSALLPMLSVTALNIAWLVGGVVVVETVFTYPGLGRLLVNAVGDLDVPLVLGITLIMTFAYVLVNLAVDIAAIIIDPRLRTK